MPQRTIVLDTSVVVDMFVRDRERHDAALGLARRLRELDFHPTLPCHALLEIACAIRNERQVQGMPAPISFQVFTKEFPLSLHMVPIDMQFVHEYLDHSLPYLKAGDLIFIAIARREGLALVTEDNKQYAKAAEAGVKAFRISEFVRHLDEHPIG